MGIGVGLLSRAWRDWVDWAVERLERELDTDRLDCAANRTEDTLHFEVKNAIM